MLYINNAILRKDYTPNTFIGGVGSTITSASSIATILNVPQNWIKNFNIVDDDIEFHIRREYSIPGFAFQDNDEITYYRDEGAMCFGIGQGAFRGCVELEEFKGLAVVWVGGETGSINDNGSFRDCVKLKRFITSEAWINCNRYAFDGCTILSDVDIRTVTEFRNSAVKLLAGCMNLPPIVFNDGVDLGRLEGIFQEATVSGVDLGGISGLGTRFFGFHGGRAALKQQVLYSENITWLGTQAVNSLLPDSTLEKVEFPNCTSVGNLCFHGNGNVASFKEIILPKAVTFTGERHFGSFAGDLIDLRSLKSFGTSTESFWNISTHGVIIKLHEDIDPNDPNITYAQSRNVIIKLYDDNGDYVSDL